MAHEVTGIEFRGRDQHGLGSVVVSNHDLPELKICNPLKR
jgi:hypothetical protein